MRAHCTPATTWLLRCAALALVVLIPAVSYADTEVHATAKPRVVGQGEFLAYSISASARGNQSIQITSDPDFSGAFQVVGTTNAPSFIFQNGQSQRSLTRTYRLRALKQGQFTIKAPMVVVGGQRFQPNAVSVKVTAAGQAPKAKAPRRTRGNDRVFVDYDLQPTRKPYVGEQLTLSYYLYSDAFAFNVNPQPPKEPSLTDFWIEDLSQQVSGRRQTVQSHGHLMEQATLRAYALFPLHAGPTTIEPLQVDAVAGGFMSGRQMLHLQSDPIKIDVQPLPPNAPDSFYEGNVGQWQFEVTTDRIKAKMGRPITVRVRAHGTGQLGRLALPRLPDIDGARQAGTDDKSHQHINHGIVGGEKVVEYTLVADREGTLTIPSLEFSYFDPQAETYKTIHSEPIHIDIKGGKAPLDEQATPKATHVKKDEKADVQHALLDKLDAPRDQVAMISATKPLSERSLFWLGLALPALGLLGVWLEGPIRERFSRSRPRRNRGTAYKKALATLDEAQNASARETLDHIRAAVSLYLVEVAGVPAGAVSQAGLPKHLKKRGVDDALVERCATLLGDLNAARYSPDADAKHSRAQALLDEGRQCIEQLEKARRAKKWQASAVLGVLLAATLLAGTLTPAVAHADQAPQPAVAQAVKAQKAKHWKQAAGLWKQVAAQKPQAADVLYDLGTDLARAGDYGPARLALERAALARPGDARIEKNRDVVRQLVRLRQVEQAHGTVLANTTPDGLFWWQLATGVSANFFPVFLLVLMWLLFVAALVRRFSSNAVARDTATVLAGVAAVGVLICAGGWLARGKILADVKPAVVVAKEPALREGPSEHAGLADVDSILVPGVMLPVRDQRDGWVKLGFSDGAGAWTPSDNVALVEPETPHDD